MLTTTVPNFNDIDNITTTFANSFVNGDYNINKVTMVKEILLDIYNLGKIHGRGENISELLHTLKAGE
jgi:hypothetical protein